MSQPRKTHGWVRAAVDYAAPAALVVGYFLTRDLLTATWVLVAGSAVALIVGFAVDRRIAPMPLFAGGAALIFGTLTLVFKDETFVKLKPTVVNVVLAAVMLGGVALRRNPLKALLGESLKMPDTAWRTLTVRYGLFFAACAVLNEIVRNTQPNDVWVLFRMPGLPLLAVAFSLAQVPLMLRHAKAAEADAAPPEPPSNA